MKRFITTVAFAVSTLGAAEHASASFLYDVRSNWGTDTQFIVPNILTSETTLGRDRFTVNTADLGFLVVSLTMVPTAGGTCLNNFPSPCFSGFAMGDFLGVNFSTVGLPAFTSVGTFVDGAANSVTITELPSLPEPLTLSLLLTGLGAIAFIRNRRRAAS